MKIRDYFKDNLVYFGIFFLFFILILGVLYLFNFHIVAKLFIIVFYLVPWFVLFFVKFFQKKKFYDSFSKSLDCLEKKYLITEIVSEPDFLEGALLYKYLYEIDKSMTENVNLYKQNSLSFSEYLEAWCHEIKTPLSTSNLIIENNKNDVTLSILEELDKIGEYIQQIMYYARSNAPEKDYIIKRISLKGLVNDVIKSNKKSFIGINAKLEVDVSSFVYCDKKWLVFILNQIISNSIKYRKDDFKLVFSSFKTKENVVLSICDNGIGIEKSELAKVFDKGFTGTNGRKNHNSTGMGLYLCRKLLVKLGCDIQISSVLGEGTCVNIVFPINSMTDELTNV